VTKKKDISTSANLIVAAIAGSINVVVTCPLWVANTRLKLQNKADAKTAKKKPYKSLWDAVVRIYKEEGLAALWDGEYLFYKDGNSL
jgi:adenine nucleotide transporter 17